MILITASSVLSGLKANSDSLSLQIRQIRDQMRVIKLKRDLEKEKDELQTLKQQRRGEGVNKHKYS